MRAHLFYRRLLLLLGGLLLLLPASAQCCFSDVTSQDIDRNAIDGVVTNQLMEGFPDCTFRPDAPMRRDDEIMIMARLLNTALQGFMVLPGSATSTAQPLGIPAGHWAYPAANFLVSHGILDTHSLAVTDLGAPLTRGELLDDFSRLLHADHPLSTEKIAKELADNRLLPEGWQDHRELPVTRREAARLLDGVLSFLTQNAVAEGSIVAFETDEQGDRWVRLATTIGEARLMFPTSGVLVKDGTAENLREGARIRTLSDTVSGTERRAYYRVREVTVLGPVTAQR